MTTGHRGAFRKKCAFGRHWSSSVGFVLKIRKARLRHG
jgi:hypothetical protein